MEDAILSLDILQRDTNELLVISTLISPSVLVAGYLIMISRTSFVSFSRCVRVTQASFSIFEEFSFYPTGPSLFTVFGVLIRVLFVDVDASKPPYMINLSIPSSFIFCTSVLPEAAINFFIPTGFLFPNTWLMNIRTPSDYFRCIIRWIAFVASYYLYTMVLYSISERNNWHISPALGSILRYFFLDYFHLNATFSDMRDNCFLLSSDVAFILMCSLFIFFPYFNFLTNVHSYHIFPSFSSLGWNRLPS